MLDRDFEDAINLARLKAELQQRLAHLSDTDHRRLLTELIVGREVEGRANGGKGTKVVRADESEQIPPPKAPKGTKTEELLTYLQNSPGAVLPTIAQEVYGSDDAKARERARSMLNALKRRGKVRKSAAGRWRAVNK